MGVRVAVNYAVFAVLLGMLGFLNLLTNLRYVPQQLTVAVGVFGVLVGAITGVAAARRQLKFLTKNGEFRTGASLSTILFIAGGIFILFSLWFFFAFDAPIGSQAAVMDFMFSILPALLASQAILFLRWERKHGKLIIASMWPSRLYASPRTD
jgi:hypothetical protein